MLLGSVGKMADGRYALRLERTFAHPQAKVWRALTETEHLRAWFVEILDYDRSSLVFAEGAELVFVPHGEMPAGHGRVTRFEPPDLLEYTWETETLRWELEAAGNGGCRLVFTNILDDRDSAVAVAPGWHAGLDYLTAHLDGREIDRSTEARLHEEYTRALG